MDQQPPSPMEDEVGYVEYVTRQEQVGSHDSDWDDQARVNFFMRHLTAIDDEEARLKEQHQRRLASCGARRAALVWRHGAGYRTAVESLLAKQTSSAKSIATEYGKTGFRTARATLWVTNNDEAVEWVLERPHLASCLDVTLARTTPLKDHLTHTGEMPPGCEYLKAREKFFPACSRDDLDEAHALALRAMEEDA